jgi:nucleoside-diphosphate-sugar epimerase
VADAAEGFALALDAPEDRIRGEIFNIGSNQQNYQIGQLGDLVAQSLPEVEIETIDQPPDLRDYHVNFDKAGRVLDYRVQYTVADAIAEIERALTSGHIVDPSDPRYRNA